MSKENAYVPTSFHNDRIYASANEISKKFGVEIDSFGDEKTNFEFALELEDGTPFYLYDWKEGSWVTEDTKLYYHIGANNALDSHKVCRELGRYFQTRNASDMESDIARLMMMLGR